MTVWTGKLDTFAPHAKVIHIDIDAAEFNKLRVANASLRGDINLILPQLELSQDISPWVHHSESLRSGFKWRYDHPGDLIFAPLMLKQLSDMMPENSIISTDVGQHQMWAAQHTQPREPQNFITSAGLGTMGFGLPAAMGASVARPDDQSILISGDGSFMMNVQELGTLKRRQIPVKIVLINNQRLGMVRQWQSLFFDGRHSETILDDNPDFVMLAKAFDIPGKTITRKEEVEPALKEMLESKTAYMLHVLISEEENVWPLVPPGASNSGHVGEHLMERYLLDIKADDKPVLLERVLRVIRHRGFIIKQVAATQNHESKVASVEIIVDSDRPISFLVNQIEKLWDIKNVDVITISKNELPNNNLQQSINA